MNDRLFDGLKLLMMFCGGGLVAKGWIGSESLEPLVDAVIAFIGSGVVIGGFVWAIWSKWNTSPVSNVVIEAAKRDPRVPNIPTVSPVTGAANHAGT